MNLIKFIFIVVTWVQVQAFNSLLVPDNKEVVYKWNAKIIVGTHLPAIYGSDFTLNGNIHLQSNNNVTHVKISDLTYKIYNGLHDHVKEKETKSFPLPGETKDLLKVFKIAYDDKGLVDGISTAEDEKEFSRNIKKAVATILQMDDSVLNKVYNKSESFMIKENSIYGYSTFVYDVMPKFGGIGVHKFHEMSSTKELYRYFFSNIEQLHCDAPYEEVIMRNNMKRYLIVNQDGQNIVKRVTTDGDIVYYPFKARSDYQIIKSMQSFELVEVVPIQQRFRMESEYFEDHLTYQPFQKSPDGTVDDITNGRRIINETKLVGMVQNSVREMCEYKRDDLQKQEPKNMNAKQINKIQDILLKLDAKNLEKIRNNLVRDNICPIIFYEILPFVGTDASTLYIKDIIVEKKVDDSTAVSLLENFAENVGSPTKELVTKLEQLIHFSDNTNWNTRKAAILSFGVLVHKSHVFYKRVSQNEPNRKYAKNNQSTDDTSLFYEKYVLEYIDKLKTSEDRNIKLAYFSGLYNMKLPSIGDHLLPAVNGEWWNDKHLRFLSIWVAGISVLSTPEQNGIINILWPIFINRQEDTQLRLVAYFYIMLSQPNYSRLRNIFHAMSGEPDQELYSYHYTYVKSIMQSNDPCKQNWRVKMAQMLKVTSPPTHGLSSFQLYDYRDVRYDFGSSMQFHTVRSNGSSIYYFTYETQEFNILKNELAIYVKIYHSGKRKGNLEDDLVMSAFYNNPIEINIQKRGNVINCFYFTHTNEAIEFLNFLTNKRFEKKFLYIDYRASLTAMLPIDFGIPVFWEYQIPELNQNNFISSYNEKGGQIGIENTFSKSIFFRHGLTAYNPLLDAWQGINRINTFDAALPLTIIVNSRNSKIWNITWIKHQDPLKNIVGIRSHVKQIVFVRNDDERSLLSQSNPHSKSFVTVDYEDKYRHDYTIIEKDDLNTGHKLYIGFFDSSVEFSYGDFKNQMTLFLQTFTKHYNSPLTHLLLSLDNFLKYVLMSPVPGNYGFLVRVEPSQEHSVDKISLILSNERILFPPHYINNSTLREQVNYNFTYDIRNSGSSLKSWTGSIMFDMNSGHTVNDLNINLTQQIHGQQDYNVLLKGTKKWSTKDVTGHLNVEMCKISNNQCVENSTIFDVTMTGKRSLEQEFGKHYYGACQYIIFYHQPHYHSLDCLISHSTVRHYIYNVKTSNVPSEFQNVALQLWDHFKNYYYSYYSTQNEHNDTIDNNNIKIDIKYSMQENKVNLHLATSRNLHSLTGVPTDYLEWFGLYPDSLAYSTFFTNFYKKGQLSHCTIYPHQYQLNDRIISTAVPEEWTTYLTINDDDRHTEIVRVYVKRIRNSTIAVKVFDLGHSVEIESISGDPRLTLDGQVVPLHEQDNEEWMYYHVFVQDIGKPIAVMLKHSGIHLEYEGDYLKMVVPRAYNAYGLCYDISFYRF